MACSSTFTREGLTLQALSTLGSPTWLTSPQPCAGLSYVDAVLRPVDVQGNARVQLLVQFFESDLQTPDSPTTVGSATASALKVSVDVSSTAATKAFFRMGVSAVLSSGSTPASIGVSVDGALRQCGQVLGKADVELVAGPAQISYVPVGGLMSARAIATVCAVIRVTGKNVSNLGTRLALRTFTTDGRAPSAWSLLEAGWDTVSSTNDVRFTGTLSPSLAPDTNQWFQLGLGLQPASTDVSAMVSVLGMGASS